MKIILKQIYGDQENFDLQINKPTLILDNTEEEILALESGWSIYKNNWFLSRMTRIDLSKYNKTPSKIKNHLIEYLDTFEVNEEVLELYKTFSNVKGFSEVYDIASDAERSSCVIIRKDGILVAFTKFVKYVGGIESQYTILDYKEPKLSIGRKIVDYEVYYAKAMGYDYLYVGSGYGTGAIYKASFLGFEWWNGDIWSADKEAYIELCNRDSKITDLTKLNEMFNDA